MRELRSFRQTAVWTTSYDGTTEPEICSEMIRRICCPGISMISTRFDEFKLQYPRPSAKKSIKNHRPSQYVLDPPVRILAICDKLIENVLLCYFSFLIFGFMYVSHRAWVSTGATGAWHLQNFWTALSGTRWFWQFYYITLCFPLKILGIY